MSQDPDISDLKRQREEEESSTDDDSDIEFILAPRPGAGPTVRPVIPEPAQAPSAQPGLRHTDLAAGAAASAAPAKPKVPGVDVDAVATLDGKPITQVDLNSFEEKPWRKPGADISDYFNYGFDEFTWTAYCSKQDYTRTQYTPQKVMAQMGMPPMFMPGMGMPMMPGMPQMNMQGANGQGAQGIQQRPK